ncbi:spore coat protein U [Brenneria roseae subsp. roseae]|uniref:Csu type fimbrial protein n=1 Tax=Brenneria roseae TaxID=1509241 RepID=UPI000D614E20|nr:spore coat U domain-containing protein [Brenneria roseae]PWC22955.1 spore coat protein U [Brenneria roseae subsp. roseae]
MRIQSAWFSFFALLTSPLFALTVSSSFTVNASIQKGCAFGSSVNSSQSAMGTINFGTQSAAASNVDVASTAGNGSIVITCTPGITVTVEMDYGLHGGNSTQRYVMNTAGTHLLPYQLYRDAARTQVWGTDASALNISSFPSATQTYTVYARYFGASPYPPAGQYTDSITVSLTY